MGTTQYEQNRTELMALGEMYEACGGQELALRLIRRGGNAADFHKEIQPKYLARKQADMAAGFGASATELKQFSVARLVRGLVLGQTTDAGLELDMCRAAAQRAGIETAGQYIPFAVLTRDFNVGTATEAGNFVTTAGAPSVPVTPASRPRPVLADMGASIITGYRGSELVPAIATAVTAESRTEIQAANEKNPTSRGYTLALKRVTAYAEVSRQAVVQGQPSALEAVISDEINKAINQQIENLAFSGTTSGGETTGIRAWSGVGTVTGGTDGAQLTWAHLVDLEGAPGAANASEGPAGYVVNSATRKWMKKTQRGTGTSTYLWNPDAPLPVNGYRARMSNLLPSNISKGSGTNLSALIYSSNWSRLLVALGGLGVDLMVDKITLASTGQVRIIAAAYVDTAVLEPAAFAHMSDAATA